MARIQSFSARSAVRFARTASIVLFASALTGSLIAPPAFAVRDSADHDLDALRDAGDNFDQVYLEQQAAAHEKALNMLRNYAESGDTPALQQFASQTAGVVEGHLEEVRQLQQ